MISVYLTVQQVLDVHKSILNQYGGSHGLRSQELLESAVFRMKATFGGVDLYEDNFAKAAALLESLCKNHPFVDGNKRTAFTCAVTFLEINGYEMKFDQEEGEEFMIDVASSRYSFEAIAEYLKKNYVK